MVRGANPMHRAPPSRSARLEQMHSRHVLARKHFCFQANIITFANNFLFPIKGALRTHHWQRATRAVLVFCGTRLSHGSPLTARSVLHPSDRSVASFLPTAEKRPRFAAHSFFRFVATPCLT